MTFLQGASAQGLFSASADGAANLRLRKAENRRKFADFGVVYLYLVRGPKMSQNNIDEQESVRSPRLRVVEPPHAEVEATDDIPVFATFKAPLYVAWEVSHRCNARCMHCYSASSPQASTSSDLTTTEALDLIDQLARAGTLVLALSGGEPLLRPDWHALVRHATRRGLSVNIGTNGALVSESVADQLAASGVTSVTVSIDSHDPDTHDTFRGLPGLHHRAVRAIRRLVARGLRVVVGFTPTKHNWRDGPDVVRLARDLGASAVNLSEYVPAGRGTADLALAPKDLRSVLADWIRMRVEHRDAIEIMWHDCRVGMLVPEEEKRQYVGCGAGRLVARVTPDGMVTPCVFLPTAIGSIRNESFHTMWSQSPLLLAFRRRVGAIKGNCGACQHLEQCGGCRAVAYAYSGGDPLAGDPHCWIHPGNADEMSGLSAGESLPV